MYKKASKAFGYHKILYHVHQSVSAGNKQLVTPLIDPSPLSSISVSVYVSITNCHSLISQ